MGLLEATERVLGEEHPDTLTARRIWRLANGTQRPNGAALPIAGTPITQIDTPAIGTISFPPQTATQKLPIQNAQDTLT